MILKLNDFSAGQTIESDAVVVGAGAIGIATAVELARSGVRVALIESGLTRRDRTAQSLAEFDSRQDDFFNARREVTVRRQVGGTTAMWGGRCVPYDPIDFEYREFVSNCPTWPIGYDDLKPYMQRACDWFDCGRNVFNARLLPELSGASLVPGLPEDGVLSTDLERWSLPARFGKSYSDLLRTTPGLVVWTGVTCTEVVTTPDGDSVDHLVVKALDGREGRAVANDYIIATGGLEATRLLLHSDRNNPNGLGNSGGHLGRWYMSHVDARVAAIRFNSDAVIYEHERDADGVYVRRRFTFSPELQRKEQIPNAAVWLVNPPISNPDHGNGVLSGVYLTLISPIGRFLLTDAIREAHTKSSGAPRIAAHVRNIFRDLIPSIKFAFSFSWGRFFRRGRKIPGFFVKSADNAYPLQYQGEHLPHWESRVELTDERDILGMRKIRTHTHFSDEDYRSVGKAIDLIDRHLRRYGVGHVEWLTDDVAGTVREHCGNTVGFHQVGTTRMSDSPADGVVDRDLQVHGVQGLYVASTSVLPTSGQANPTLAGLALGIRLADHLIRVRDGSRISADKPTRRLWECASEQQRDLPMTDPANLPSSATQP